MDIIFTPKTTEAALGTDDAGSSNVGTLDATTSLNITCCPYGNNQIFTLVVLDNT